MLVWVRARAQIFMLDVKEQDRSQADGQRWKEDAQWARILDEGWDLGRVKQARPATSLEHPHEYKHAGFCTIP